MLVTDKPQANATLKHNLLGDFKDLLDMNNIFSNKVTFAVILDSSWSIKVSIAAQKFATSMYYRR